MNTKLIVCCVWTLGLSAAFSVHSQEQPDSRIDPAKIKDAMNYANTNKEFAEVSAANLDESAVPRGIGDSDPAAVKQIVALEMAIEKSYNTDFPTHPDAPLKYWVSWPDRCLYDSVAPGEYYGDDVLKIFKFVGPAFIGRLEYKEIKVYAKGSVGFVYMKQNYYGKSLNGQPMHWITRQTDGVVKEKGEWKVLLSHVSFPVDLTTMKADLKSSRTPLPWDRVTQK